MIAGGGGGIPVVRRDGWTKAIDAVIDKDRTSILLAADTECDALAILTGVEKVAVDFNKPDQRDLDQMTLAECEQFIAEGQFPAGSMLPEDPGRDGLRPVRPEPPHPHHLPRQARRGAARARPAPGSSPELADAAGAPSTESSGVPAAHDVRHGCGSAAI